MCVAVAKITVLMEKLTTSSYAMNGQRGTNSEGPTELGW